jgi:predicted nucleic-acid-binding protein
MIGLDTNVLIRLLVADDPIQAEEAKRFVDTHCSPQAPAFINCVVLAEVVWVLDTAYGYSRQDIANVVEALIAGSDRLVEHSEAVRAALRDYRSSRITFADAMIGHIDRAYRCKATATFDRKAARLETFVPVA